MENILHITNARARVASSTIPSLKIGKILNAKTGTPSYFTTFKFCLPEGNLLANYDDTADTKDQLEAQHDLRYRKVLTNSTVAKSAKPVWFVSCNFRKLP